MTSAATGPADPSTQFDCNDTEMIGSLALDRATNSSITEQLADHVRTCPRCAENLSRMATARAVVAGSTWRPTSPTSLPLPSSTAHEAQALSDATPDRVHRRLLALAMALDPMHAEDLVQDTWDRVLNESTETPPDTASPNAASPDEDDLRAELFAQASRHVHADENAQALWADALVAPHRHSSPELSGADTAATALAPQQLRELSDLGTLDIDADHAELYFPDFYEDGPDQPTWSTPPVAWPAITRILGPEAEIETTELYQALDEILDQLPERLADALYLVDIEGHSIQTAASLLETEPVTLTSWLIPARREVRSRISAYLSAGTTDPSAES